MQQERLNNISICVRGFPVEDQSMEKDNNEMWMKRGKLLRRMEDLENDFLSGRSIPY